MTEITLWRRYEIEAAHQLAAGVPEGHKCRRLHGHRYVITLGLRGPVNPETGMVLEYADFDSQVWPILKRIDHYSLNTLNERHSTSAAQAVSDNPTVELLCVWLVEALGFLRPHSRDLGFRLVGVRIEEDSRSSVEWKEGA